MCVYLAPRWRRRLSPLLVTIVLALALLLTVDGRTLRSQETGHSGSGYTEVTQQEVGVVTTDTTQSTTTVAKAWHSGDGSQLGEQKSVSFDSLVKTMTAPEQLKESAASGSTTMDHEILSPKTSSSDCSREGKSNMYESDTKQDDDDGSFNKNEKHESEDSNRNTNDKTSTKTGTFNKAIPTPTPTPGSKTSIFNKATQAPTPVPTPPTPGSTPTATTPGLPPHPGTFEAKPKDWWSSSGSTEQSVTGESYEESSSTNSAQVLEKKTKSASLTTSSTALDQTLVVVIVGVVGAIGALLMFASRKVLKEMGDDKDLEDTSIF